MLGSFLGKQGGRADKREEEKVGAEGEAYSPAKLRGLIF